MDDVGELEIMGRRKEVDAKVVLPPPNPVINFYIQPTAPPHVHSIIDSLAHPLVKLSSFAFISIDNFSPSILLSKFPQVSKFWKVLTS
jgi:hypothetical protein